MDWGFLYGRNKAKLMDIALMEKKRLIDNAKTMIDTKECMNIIIAYESLKSVGVNRLEAVRMIFKVVGVKIRGLDAYCLHSDWQPIVEHVGMDIILNVGRDLKFVDGEFVDNYYVYFDEENKSKLGYFLKGKKHDRSK